MPHKAGPRWRPTLPAMIATATAPTPRPRPPAPPSWPTPPARDSAIAADARLRDWLAPHRDALFGWTMARQPDADARRGLAEVAVSLQRLHGRGGHLAWLYGAALHAAAASRGAASQGLAEPPLTGLAPELRTLLRLVARGTLPPDAAMALLDEPMGGVRQRLLRLRWPQKNQFC